MNGPSRFTIVGAGNGGRAMAAHLAILGAEVTLFNRTWEHITFIAQRGGIDLESPENGPRGFAKLVKVTSDIQEAVAGAEVIMVVVPSSAHAELAISMAPFLKDGQT